MKERLGWALEIVKPPRRWVRVPADREPPRYPAGFIVLPRRWVIERTIAWVMRNRRMSRDYEVLTETTEALVYVAMIRLMLREGSPKHPPEGLSDTLSDTPAPRYSCPKASTSRWSPRCSDTPPQLSRSTSTLTYCPIYRIRLMKRWSQLQDIKGFALDQTIVQGPFLGPFFFVLQCG